MDCLRRSLPKFRILSEKEQTGLAELIWHAGSYHREHPADPETEGSWEDNLCE
jgi:hypothetical protein